MRFHASIPPLPCDETFLEGDEAHHLLHVLRAKAGDSIELFDGRGTVATARILATHRQRVHVQIISRTVATASPGPHLALAVALPKGERQSWLVEKVTELGITELIPLITQRGVAQPTENALMRLERTSVQACKQSGRNHGLQISQPMSLADLVKTKPFTFPGIADPRAELHLLEMWNAPTPSDVTSVCLAIGPEGGFTTEEVDLARHHGWPAYRLARHILRVETAALTAASLLQAMASRLSIENGIDRSPPQSSIAEYPSDRVEHPGECRQ